MGYRDTLLAPTTYLDRVDPDLVEALQKTHGDQEAICTAVAGVQVSKVRDAVRSLLSEDPFGVVIPREVADVTGYRSVALLVARRILRNPGWYLSQDIQWARKQMRITTQ